MALTPDSLLAMVAKPQSTALNVLAKRCEGLSKDVLKTDALCVLKELSTLWKADPEKFHPSWQKYFEGASKVTDIETLSHGIRGSVVDGMIPNASSQVRDTARILSMVRHFQKLGHFQADVDPLQLPKEVPYISYSRARTLLQIGQGEFHDFGFSKEDFNRPVSICLPNTGGIVGTWHLDRADRHQEWEGKFTSQLPQDEEAATREWTIGQIYERLRQIYCGHIGLEYLHIHNRRQLNWLRNQMETPYPIQFSQGLKKQILLNTAKSVLFETFAGQRFGTTKRFGLDGCESLIAGMMSLTKLASLLGVESILVGMAHRGRLNLLTNVMKKPALQVFSEFMGHTGFGGCDWGNSGDVKYHLGVEYEFVDSDTSRSMLMSVLPNPSHLEAVNPVILGTCKARQKLLRDTQKEKVLPILIHGDASMAGQGIIYETLQMVDLPGYSTGGTIHIIVNNQIGFTTTPADGGSGNYCSDIAKAINSPIFHVNADDPEAVARVMEIAVKWRQKFHKDVFIDLIGYRRYGHNELDMPKFTNPIMYKKIETHPNVLELYSAKLIGEKAVTAEEVSQLKKEVLDHYNESYKGAKTYKTQPSLRPFSVQWKSMATPNEICSPRLTGVPLETLKMLGLDICRIPSHVKAHPTIARIYKQREQALHDGKNIDFGLAEALAFASLVHDGYSVRLGGQDSERGTFSHRHAVLHDQDKVAKTYIPVQEMAQRRHYNADFEIYNSPLSEYACLGYEYGYSLENPNYLNIWEAQFGDFSNGAQVVIDQFVTAGEVKWNHPSGLVMLLPHGFDGQGPEHSSARLERFLQLCDDREDAIHPETWDVAKRSVIQKHNIQVVMPTTAANYFHALRRQVHRGFRKPLILLVSKKLLRHKGSELSDFTEGTRFGRYVFDPAFRTPGVADAEEPDKKSRGGVQRLILCSGQVYYDLVAARDGNPALKETVSIGRVEQLSPCPLDRIREDIQSLPNLKKIVWCQEEPMNMGSWGYMNNRIKALLKYMNYPNGVQDVMYAGRDVCASPATGDAKIHEQELRRFVSDAMTGSVNSFHRDYSNN